ncbi:unnamed protein product [Eruca vesicaria subsp. sativa]|uniref:Uncharacterized protein n=1 Tax=Eruca vesicaria subsp. sativa TaxID=29727 RepID=A0ABC8LQK7_ERUVS|nr:unnamed protein product [Eruca vesicaria subsp. sativa]
MEFVPCDSLEINASTSLGLMKRKVQNDKKALIEARDEIQEKNREIEQLNKTILQMRRNLEKKQMVTVNKENEDEILGKLEEFYV